MWWTDLAERRPTSAHGGSMYEVRGLVIHIAQGYYEGTISTQQDPSNNVSSHFVTSDGVKGQGQDGDIAQCVDTDLIAWTQQNGNGHWLSVENAGFIPHPLTDAQVEAIAQLFARGHREYGYPLQLATSPEGRGLGHHSMGTNGHDNPTDTWTGPQWGHEDCPGPNIVKQKQAILDRAIAIVNGDDDMASPEATDTLAILTAMAAGADSAVVHDKDGRIDLTPFYKRIAKETVALIPPSGDGSSTPHDHPVSVSVSTSGSGSGRTGPATPTPPTP